jgi:fermentation-respiration switch protein FrsA (DUF1100 family)
MSKKRFFRRRWRLFALLLVAGGIIYLLTTSNPAIWPARNVLVYHLVSWWEARTDTPVSPEPGALPGCVRDTDGAPVPAATVLLSEPDGTTHTDTTRLDGCYDGLHIPPGRYVPMAGAPDYGSTAVRPWGVPISIGADEQQTLDITLPPPTLPDVAPGENLRIGQPVTRTWDVPQSSAAVRRDIRYTVGGAPGEKTWLYLPTDATQALPTLLAVYPGPVEGWEGVSIPLAAAGYAVIALGPEYTLELDTDIDTLQRLVAFARAGRLPGADGSRIVVLGGSYSGLHALRLLKRDTDFRGMVLLGPPTDLFDLRRRFENGSFFPPYGLDQALISLGFPNTAPERYWRYSARYHVRADWPPLLLMHSRDDEIVPFQQTELFAAELDRVGVPYDAHFFDGLSHYLLEYDAAEGLTRLYGITTDFLDRSTRERSQSRLKRPALPGEQPACRHRLRAASHGPVCAPGAAPFRTDANVTPAAPAHPPGWAWSRAG